MSEVTQAQVTGQPGFGQAGQHSGSGLGFRPKPLKRLYKDDGNGQFVRRTASEVYGVVAQVETRLYGKTYWENPLNKRFRRIEKTLFGTPKRGNLENRLVAIEENLKISSRPNAQHDQHKPMIQYLETKIFQQTFPEQPVTQRIGQLETHVFGKPFYEYPIDVRIKKLTYTIPILAKEIRVSNKDAVLASSQSPSAKSRSTSTSEQPIEFKSPFPAKKGPSSIHASHATMREKPLEPNTHTIHAPSPTYSTPKEMLKTPEGQPVLTGDYLNNTYRSSQGEFLRWINLPIQVYVQNASQNELTLTREALELWGHHFPVKQSSSPYEADVFIEWNRKPASQNPITRPILHLDGKKNIRTLILIDMTPYKHLPPLPNEPSLAIRLRHGVLHQLGHAFGIWGHSNNPHDVLYPVNGLEDYDIPKSWNRRSPRQSSLSGRRLNSLNTPQPSPRDIKTLTQIYQKTGKSLKSYSPYH